MAGTLLCAGEKRKEREITNRNKTHSYPPGVLQSGERGRGKQLAMIKTEYKCHIEIQAICFGSSKERIVFWRE